MTASPLDWKPLAGRALESALNRAVALDPDTREALPPLDGRSVVLALAGGDGSDAPPLALRLTVDGDRLRVGPVDPAATPDLAVRSTLGGVVSVSYTHLDVYKRQALHRHPAGHSALPHRPRNPARRTPQTRPVL